MARSILSLVCLAFLLLYKYIDCETVGNISETLETSVGISIDQSPNKALQPISRNITPGPQDSITQTLEIPKILEYRARIVKTPPKPGATAAKTIKYRLGKRVPGKQLLESD